jgi:hypothetical protein
MENGLPACFFAPPGHREVSDPSDRSDPSDVSDRSLHLSPKNPSIRAIFASIRIASLFKNH